MTFIERFLSKWAICSAGFVSLVVIGWAWVIGLMWTAEAGISGPAMYIIVTICVIPAIALTLTILDKK
jgi:hypothetical protein